jgi:hypothetical protein
VLFYVAAHCGEDGWQQVSNWFNRRKQAEAECRKIHAQAIEHKRGEGRRLYYSAPCVWRVRLTADDVADMAEMRKQEKSYEDAVRMRNGTYVEEVL